VLYGGGLGVDRDEVKGRELMARACELGDETACGVPETGGDAGP
jgi:TPR repeat protein